MSYINVDNPKMSLGATELQGFKPHGCIVLSRVNLVSNNLANSLCNMHRQFFIHQKQTNKQKIENNKNTNNISECYD